MKHSNSLLPTSMKLMIKKSTANQKIKNLQWNGCKRKFAAGQQREFREARVQQLLDRELLPHLGDSEEARMKKAFI